MTKLASKLLVYCGTVALVLSMGTSVLAQSTNNPRYRQFRDTAAASISTPATGNVRLFFDSTGFYWKNSAGVVSAVGSGGYDMLVASGANDGTLTLFDSTLTTGVSRFVIQAGQGQSTTTLQNWSNYAGTPLSSITSTGSFLAPLGSTSAVGMGFLGDPNTGLYSDGADRMWLTAGGQGVGLVTTTGLYLNGSLDWADAGIARTGAGILKVTDGSTGQGGIGLSDSATNTVTDALILKHATSDAGFGQDEFGTGLLFQGEDGAGNMQSMGSIDAIFTDSANGSEDTRFEWRGFVGGTEYKFASLGDADNSFSIYDTSGAVRFRYTNYSYTLSVGGTSRIRIIGDGSNALVFPDVGSIYGDDFEKVNVINPVLQRGTSYTLTDDTATTFVTIPIATDTAIGGVIEYTILFSTGGNMEIESGELYFTGTNEAGTELGHVSEIGTPLQTPAGTMTTDFTVVTGTDNMSIQVDANSTALAVNPVIVYRVRFNSGAGSFTTP